MKKRLIITLVLILSLVQIVNADIVIEPLAQTEYNIGDQFNINGHVILQQDVKGRFKLSLKCNEKEEDMVIKIYDFKANQKLIFDESLFLITTNPGECKFKITIDDLNNEIESEESQSLEISQELKSNVSINIQTIQLGETIPISGKITTLNAQPITGSATIKVNKDSTTFLMTTAPIINGDVSYNLGPIFMPSGNYDVVIEAKDSLGNSVTSSHSFELKSEIELRTELDKDSIYPNEEIQIIGEISYAKQQVDEDAELRIKLDNQEIYTKKFKNQFSYKYKFPKDIEAGTKAFTISVEDSFGNRGEQIHEIEIKQKPTSISITIDDPEPKPNTTITITAKLLDQTQKQINKEVDIKVKREQIYIEGKDELTFTIPVYELPGEIEVIANSESIKSTSTLTIPEIKEISTTLEGSNIIITNIGNVRYKEEVSVTLVGKTEYIIDQKVNLKPGESTTIDVSKQVPGNNYTIILPNNAAMFPNINIPDNRPFFEKTLQENMQSITDSLGKFKLTLFIILLIIIIILIALGLWFFRHHKTSKKESKEIRHLVKGKFHKFSEKIKDQKKKLRVTKKALKQESKEKEKIRDLFEKFVDPAVATEIISRKNLKHGQKKEITAMFIDIRGFSALSEKSDAWLVRNVLNKFFEKMANSIKNNGGIVNKYMGDAIFAIFNAPKELEDHIFKTVKTALEIKEELKHLNKKLSSEGQNTLAIGIGINFGEAVIGYLGAANRLEYTAIGNSINIASRLESNAKPNEILVSEQTLLFVKDKVNAEYNGVYEVKNIAKPLKVYNILSLK